MSEAKLDQILQMLSGLGQDVSVLKQDVSVLKQDVSVLKQDVSVLKQGEEKLRADVAKSMAKQDETVAAFRSHWGDMMELYRRVRDDVKHFEDRIESKLSQINQSIQALRDSLERQDFRADELGRRVLSLEEQRREI